ncbi:BON domain-containing protein [Bordetella genomosp. 11]|uniref:Ornithine aminotransferase n=1 Tax=Bordetella genomosp. 11 TaxID=1416808 RepID=A0A261UFQ1_9BORD|nr:BON domain-containing protein [Bordetella genomosp. 11]OZI60734.1 ornithine aminotransferase [Bordetella genomosp. 11]
MNDAELRKRVLEELEFDPSLDAAHIGVAVEDGIATLTGHVSAYAQKYNAERAAQRVKGVRGIAQEIEVRPPTASPTDDDQLAKRALDLIAWDASLPADAVKVKVERGWVTLSGEVEWHHQRMGCESAVRRLAGVTGVSNLIELRHRVQSGDIRASVDQALRRSAEVEAGNIRLHVNGGEVTLSGTTRSWHERNAVQRAAWAVPGVTSVVNHLTVV